jgi:chromosomal replication initiator protein
LIAKCVKSSVRDLESSLVQLKGYYDLTHVDIDLQLAREYLKLDEHIENQKLVTVDFITKAVAQYFKIPLGDIRGKSKTKEIVLARQVAMYLIHQHLRKTLLEIALFFGKKDHTTPMYSLEVVKKRIKNDPHFAQQMLEIENLL